MAAITARSAMKRVPYHDLQNLSTADLLFGEKKKKRRPFPRQSDDMMSEFWFAFIKFSRQDDWICIQRLAYFYS